MAQRIVVRLTDDLDGSEIPEGEGQTVTFAIQGTEYELDLSKKNTEKFMGAFDKYIAAARRTGGRRSSSARTRTAASPDSRAVRAWAQSNGIEVSPRGRVSSDVVAKFQEAGN